MMLNRTSKEIKEELSSLEETILHVWEEALGQFGGAPDQLSIPIGPCFFLLLPI